MKSLKVALLQSPFWGVDSPPLWMAVLSGVFKKTGAEIKIFDLNAKLYGKTNRKFWKDGGEKLWAKGRPIYGYVKKHSAEIDLALSPVVRFRPDVICFSITDSTIEMGVELATRLKKRMPGSKIVFGGYLCTSDRSPESLFSRGPVPDAVITGPAETAVPEFVAGLKKGRLEAASGLLLRGRPAHKKTARELTAEERSAPMMPDFSGFDLSLYRKPVIFPMRLSRGCTFDCVDCYLRPPWKRFRGYDPEAVFDAVRKAYRGQGARDFFFYDSALNGDIRALDRFCELARRFSLSERLIDPSCCGGSGINEPALRWGGTVLPGPELSFERLSRMRRAGCRFLYVSVQSGSAEILKLMGRKFSPDVAERFLMNAKKAGIHTKVSFRAGFPAETENDFQKTLQFVRKNRRLFGEISILRPFDLPGGTFIAEHPGKYGVKIPFTGSGWETIDGRNTQACRADRYQRLRRVAGKKAG